jgi:FixJ family two-component response regulator
MQELAPEAVLLDVEMPRLDGPGMIEEVLRIDAGLEQIPVVLVSGAPNLTTIARRSGTPYFAKKPYELTKLLAVLQRALEERTAPSPQRSDAGSGE